ncbi:hypothetical protein [Burkholderia ubonensis]|uniref:hypothetical protein n=1 Tax=Burkholderia ubonensis TaxID=101571 RepID=UPI0011607D6A|nr:hypothetical protein [Burkholderia ubonensis]
MRNHAATPHSERPESNADNVYHLTTHGRNLRQQAIREYLREQMTRHAEDSIIAIASVSMQTDGTINISAKGIEPDLADEMLDGLSHLSARIRHHTKGKPKPRSRQHGNVALGVMTAIALTACAYINAIPWIDSTLVLAAHILATLSKRRRTTPK